MGERDMTEIVKLMCILLCAYVLLEIVPTVEETRKYARPGTSGMLCARTAAVPTICAPRRIISGFKNRACQGPCGKWAVGACLPRLGV